MAELLLEILSEEIPARMQARAAADLKRLVTDALNKAGLDYDRAEAYVTPRRLALVVDGLPTETPDISEERRGPKTDAPDKAVQGFLGSAGLTLDQVEKRQTGKGEFYFAVIERKGEPSKILLAAIVLDILIKLSWAKSMRWANSIYTWVRPVHNYLAIFDHALIDFTFGLGHRGDSLDETSIEISSKTSTFGHPFLAPGEFTVEDFADYKKKLKAAKVILDPAERREMILKGAEALAAKEGLSLKDDPALLDEVTGLVEWPVVLIGDIDKEYMDLPPEVLTMVMAKHQKYFALTNKQGGLAPRFVVVADTETRDKGKAVIAGNERVLRARLADAKFFWDQDRKTKLADRVAALGGIVFHAKLGSVADKIDRVGQLAAELAENIPGADADQARRAARLAKADLTTGMVGEFADLQGFMGRYYALADGEAPEVADAIAEHYSPLGPNDACPTAPISIAVALADKIDTLVGFWAIDEKPTGSKDPFALRRAALGIIRLILENDLRLPLNVAFEHARMTFKGELARHATPERSRRADEFLTDLLSFFADRLKVHLREKGVRHDLISAVFALSHEDDLVRLMTRVDALEKFLKSDDGEDLLTAYRRAANIVRIESEKEGGRDYKKVNRDRFEFDEEDTLWQNLNAVQDSLKVSLDAEIFDESMAALAQLRKPIDAYFENVRVNVDDDEIRESRLALLKGIIVVMNQIADFSQIEGGER